MSNTNPFLDPGRQTELYGHASRLADRSNALLRAKTHGQHVPETIVRLVRTHHERANQLARVLDIGCGRGASSKILAEQLRPQRLIGVDASPTLLDHARRRIGRVSGTQVNFLPGDFHQLPLPTGSCDLAVAAFCLYHSAQPKAVVGEINRVLVEDGLAVLVTKSLDSYRELDVMVAAAGLDPQAEQHESLYIAAHSGNLSELATTHLDVITTAHEEHHFTFAGHDHTAQYLATSPKYSLAPGLYGNAEAIAAALHECLPDQPLSTRSRITFIVARARGGRS